MAALFLLLQINYKQSILGIKQYVLFVINLEKERQFKKYGEWGWRYE